MPNDPYLDASMVWRLKSGTLAFHEAGYRPTHEAILSSGLGKEADVYLAAFNGSPIAVKVYRLYRTSHRGGRPVKQESTGRLAAHEYEMTRQAWKGGALVPTPARRFENMFSMRFLGDEKGPAPRLQDVELEAPEEFLEQVLRGIEALARAGVVHADLSAFNILVYEGRPWFIDFSEALRVDRIGTSPWQRLEEASVALNQGLSALQKYFDRFGLEIDPGPFSARVIGSLDRFGVLG